MTFFKAILGAATFGVAFAPAANANPGEVEHVTEGLIVAGIAVELADVCEDVNIRMLRGFNFLQGLKNHLTDLGYSGREIDAYIDDDVEKDRLEAIARQRLSALGATQGDTASHCAVARRQMQQDTQIGQLLR